MGSHNKEQLSYRRSPSSPPETNLGAHVTLFMLLPNSPSPPAMDQMSVSPQIHVLNPNPKMWWYLEMGTLGWLGHENGALMNGISVLICAGKYLTQDSRNNWGLWEESWAISSSLQDNWGANMRHSWWGQWQRGGQSPQFWGVDQGRAIWEEMQTLQPKNVFPIIKFPFPPQRRLVS